MRQTAKELIEDLRTVGDDDYNVPDVIENGDDRAMAEVINSEGERFRVTVQRMP